MIHTFENFVNGSIGSVKRKSILSYREYINESNFDYYILDNDIETPVSRDEFLQLNTTDSRLNIDIVDNKVIGSLDKREEYFS